MPTTKDSELPEGTIVQEPGHPSQTTIYIVPVKVDVVDQPATESTS
jgi:hypothetical protein